METFTPQVALGGSVALLALIIGAVFRLLSLLRRRELDWENQLAESRADGLWCGQHRSLLITACQRAQVPIPDIVWQARPPLHARKRKRGKPDDDE